MLFISNFFYSGGKAQHDRYLGRLIAGELIAGLATTEPGAGTEVLAMRTTAAKKGNRYVLNGTKQFITNGPIGQLFLVYAKSGPANTDLNSFIVESGFRGFSVGKKESKPRNASVPHPPA